jgi:hypothetical protein
LHARIPPIVRSKFWAQYALSYFSAKNKEYFTFFAPFYQTILTILIVDKHCNFQAKRNTPPPVSIELSPDAFQFILVLIYLVQACYQPAASTFSYPILQFLYFIHNATPIHFQ